MIQFRNKNKFFRMHRTLQLEKDNGSNSFYATNYQTNNDSLFPLARRRMIQSNTETLDHLSIEAESLLDKLKQKIALDEARIEKNYSQLSQMSKQIEDSCNKLLGDKQIDGILRNKKQQIRESLAETNRKVSSMSHKYYNDEAALQQNVQIKEQELVKEKNEREQSWVHMIDEFENQIVKVQRHLKQLRGREEGVFEQMEVAIYRLEERCGQQLQQQTNSRKQEHQTVIRLIGECIQNLRLVC